MFLFKKGKEREMAEKRLEELRRYTLQFEDVVERVDDPISCSQEDREKLKELLNELRTKFADLEEAQLMGDMLEVALKGADFINMVTGEDVIDV